MHAAALRFDLVARLDISAGSGLVCIGDELVVVADDRLALSRYGHDGAPKGTIRLFEGTLPDDPVRRKRLKPDLEALVALPGGVLVVPSGSKSRRVRGAWVENGDGVPSGEWPGRVRIVDFAPLFDAIGADFDKLNIEGAARLGEHVVLLTRRTGRAGRNTIVRLRRLDLLAALAKPEPVLDATLVDGITEVELGEIDGTPLGFTDADADGAGLVFCAAAETTDDPVADGPLAGCVVGRIDAALRITACWTALPRVKIEGIALDGRGGLWAVADADDPGVPAPLLHLDALPT